jgi:NAD(P)-dependent dehydrogenase (short-subunit alcohol dehydrogenase family)
MVETMTDPFDLTEKHALVTGASRGIGLAIAAGLARRGAAVAITGRKAEGLATAANQLRASGAAALTVVCNQGDPAAISALFEHLDQQGFTPDIVIVNAGTNPVIAPLVETELAAWQKIMDVNLTGAWLTAQQAARRMIALGKGSLVLVSSVAGLDPMPGLGAYSVSKAGLIGLVKALAKELAPAQVRVNGLAPGLVDTRFAAALFQDQAMYQRLLGSIPMGRHGQPDDLVGAAVFLASDAAAYVTGQVLVVDGGGHV